MTAQGFLFSTSITTSVVSLLGSRGDVCGSLGPVAVNVTVQRCGDRRFDVLICAASAVTANLHVFDLPPATVTLSLDVVGSHTGVLRLSPVHVVLTLSVSASNPLRALLYALLPSAALAKTYCPCRLMARCKGNGHATRGAV
jgi:hypothetical protein